MHQFKSTFNFLFSMVFLFALSVNASPIGSIMREKNVPNFKILTESINANRFEPQVLLPAVSEILEGLKAAQEFVPSKYSEDTDGLDHTEDIENFRKTLCEAIEIVENLKVELGAKPKIQTEKVKILFEQLKSKIKEGHVHRQTE